MANDAGKKSKAAVDYHVGGDHCGACRHWIESAESAENEKTETGRCELVAGEIGEDMWCKLFERKNGTTGHG